MGHPGKIGIGCYRLVKLAQIVIKPEHMTHVALNCGGGFLSHSP